MRRRLRGLSDRVAGAGVVAMRTQPIPHAYRAFFRQVGLDPDAARIPSEEAAVRRLLQGRFQSRDTLQDALLIALVETGVPVWALDARRVDAGSLGIRAAASGERLGSAPGGRVRCRPGSWSWPTPRVHATLFGEPAPGHAPGPGAAADRALRGGRRGRAGDPRRGGAVGLHRRPRRPLEAGRPAIDPATRVSSLVS